MVFSTSSYGRHTEEQVASLAEWGFTHILNCSDRAPWQDEVELAHRYGLKVVLRWPDWGGLGCLGEDMSFRASDGRSNADGNSLHTGPSWWCPEAEDRALAALPRVMESGADGVLIHLITGDRPGPNCWHLTPFPNYNTCYWAFDEWSKRDWGALRTGRQFPAQAGDMADQEAYRWYQDAMFRRLGVFTQAALASGAHHVATWFVPMTWVEPETMAMGTADSIPRYENWRQSVEEAGGDPLFVVAHLFGMGSSWEHKARRTIAEVNRQRNWQTIVGMETGKWDEAVGNMRTHAQEAKAMGCSGLLAGDNTLWGQKGHIEW